MSSAADREAVARPIPLVAPVTSARRSAATCHQLSISLLSRGSGGD
jgi:hypothetical protein